MTGITWFMRFSLFALLWWVLAAGEPTSWIVGLPVAVLATLLSERLRGAHGAAVSVADALRYAGFFVSESVRGGWDVAKRALLPGQRTAPVILTYRTSLPTGWPRAVFANTVSLLPGTLTADIHGDSLTVHALARDMQPLDGVRACEQRVAAIVRVAS